MACGYILKYLYSVSEETMSIVFLTKSQVSPIFPLSRACKASNPLMLVELLSLPMSSEYASSSHTLSNILVMLPSLILSGDS